MPPITQQQLSTLLSELSLGLQQLYGPRLRGLRLYGSYATGRAAEGSDVDVAIILDDYADVWDEIQRTSQLASRLSLQYGVSLSLIRIRERDWAARDSPLLMNLRAESLAL